MRARQSIGRGAAETANKQFLYDPFEFANSCTGSSVIESGQFVSSPSLSSRGAVSLPPSPDLIHPTSQRMQLLLAPGQEPRCLVCCTCFLLSFQSTLDDATDDWGIKVERVEIKDVKLPVQLQRAMAAEAEAAREARAKVMLPACLGSVLFSSVSFLKSTGIKTLNEKQ